MSFLIFTLAICHHSECKDDTFSRTEQIMERKLPSSGSQTVNPTNITEGNRILTREDHLPTERMLSSKKSKKRRRHGCYGRYRRRGSGSSSSRSGRSRRYRGRYRRGKKGKKRYQRYRGYRGYRGHYGCNRPRQRPNVAYHTHYHQHHHYPQGRRNVGFPVDRDCDVFKLGSHF